MNTQKLEKRDTGEGGKQEEAIKIIRQEVRKGMRHQKNPKTSL